MCEGLPEFLGPLLRAGHEAEYVGEIPVDSLPRLRSELGSGGGALKVRLRLDKDGHGRVTVNGQIDGDLHLTCQRCLGTMVYRLACEVALTVIEDRVDEDRLPRGTDPLYLADDRLATATLIEDETLLALPLVPLHADPACNRDLEQLQQHEVERENPFAALGQLKRMQRKN